MLFQVALPKSRMSDPSSEQRRVGSEQYGHDKLSPCRAVPPSSSSGLTTGPGRLGLRVWLIPWRGGGVSGWFEAYPAGDRLVLKPAEFKDLPGWEENSLEEAVPVYVRSCRVLTSVPCRRPARG